MSVQCKTFGYKYMCFSIIYINIALGINVITYII